MVQRKPNHHKESVMQRIDHPDPTCLSGNGGNGDTTTGGW